MRHLHFLLLIISFFVCLSSGSIVEDTCKNISSSRPDISYDFCVKSFESDVNSSLVADHRTLAIIAAELANVTATKMQLRIKEMIEKEKNKARRNRLDTCMEVYSDAIDDINNAAGAIDSGRDTDAQMFLSAALDASSDCEDAFSEADDESPLENEDGDYGKVAAIALAVVAALE
ncbi:hypothetical protein LUZ60_016920 [Juncus effusus]|nr:hypothetical protein LUZ60_016920 [Juncus effusus]